ncbi:hypothetical protein BH10PLA2_BH10PLA2_19970 [soil metagenome]
MAAEDENDNPDRVAQFGEVVSPYALPDMADDKSLPPITEESLLQCFQFLSKNLMFPFTALHVPESASPTGALEELLVVGLLEPGENWQDGLQCKAIRNGKPFELPLDQISIPAESETRDLVEGYVEWFRSPRETPAGLVPFRQRVLSYSTHAPLKLPIGKAILFLCSAGAFIGFLLGSLLGAVQLARIGASLGAGLFGFLGVYGTFRMRTALPARSRRLSRTIVSAVYIGLMAACLGGLAGAMIVGFIGIFCGAVAGAVLGGLVKGGAAGTGFGILIGSVVGPVVLAFLVDRQNALYWGMHAAWIGAGLGGVIALLGIGAMRR